MIILNYFLHVKQTTNNVSLLSTKKREATFRPPLFFIGCQHVGSQGEEIILNLMQSAPIQLRVFILRFFRATLSRYPLSICIYHHAFNLAAIVATC
jgi:hypothetical protein